MPSIIPSPGVPGVDPNVTTQIELIADHVQTAGTVLYASSLDTLFREWGFTNPAPRLINSGTLWNANANGAALLRAHNFGGIDNRGLAVAEAATGDATTFSISSTFGGLTNSGRIFALAGANATAVFEGTPTELVNSGLIAARGGNYATALNRYNGGIVANGPTGEILAEGRVATAMFLGRGVIAGFPYPPSIQNSGRIEAASTDPSSASVAILYASATNEALSIENEGTIIGDYAFYVVDGSTTAAFGVETILNRAAGRIVGDIDTQLGDDVIVNQGEIVGYVALGESEDRFDNSAGRLTGVALLGRGADEFLGGSETDIVVADRDDDDLRGGGGNDLLLGGRGDDAIEGGAGEDGLYGEYGDDRIVTEGGDRVVAGTGNDRVALGDYRFALVDGGGGEDELVLPGAPRLLDLGAALASGRLASFEKIVLPGAQQIVIRPDDVTALTEGDELIVAGGSGALVWLVGDWTAGGTRPLGGTDYAAYLLGGATVLVESTTEARIVAAPPPGAAGLDDVAGPGLAPLPGLLPGAELASSVTLNTNIGLDTSLTIDADELRANDDGGAVVSGSSGATFVNHGTLESNGGADGANTILFGHLGRLDNHGTIRAAAPGDANSQTFTADLLRTYGVDALAWNLAGNVFALRSDTSGGPILNTGTISASSERSIASGYTTYGLNVTNQGIITSSSSDLIAIGVYSYNGGKLINSGTIEASGEIGAYGVRTSTHSTTIENSGLISAIAAADDAVEIAVSLYYASHLGSTLTNSGTIRGSTAVWSHAVYDGQGLTITNSGLIEGQIILNTNENGVVRQSDTIFNSGTIQGEIRLGGERDLYVGAGGRQIGTVHGEAGEDLLYGTGFGDSFDGGLGEDLLWGGLGADSLTGGAGRDVFVYNMVTESSGSEIDTIVDFATGTDRIDLSALGLSSFTLTPDSGETVLTAVTAAGSLTVRISGTIAAGDITTARLEGLTGTDGADLLVATTGGSTLAAGAGADLLIGAAGSDRLDGNAGGDFMRGGGGDDAYVLDSMDDRVWELADEGHDVVEIHSTYWGSLYVLPDHVEDMIVASGLQFLFFAGGNALDNVITGSDAKDQIDGGAGADRMIGGKSDDTYTVDQAGDVIVELANEGVYDAIISRISLVLPDHVENLRFDGDGDFDGTGNAGNNSLIGTIGANRLAGGDGNDQLRGNIGEDRLLGDAGNDYIEGGGHADWIEGGDGNDRLFGEIIPESIFYDGGVYAPGADDFLGTDVLIGGGGADDITAGYGADSILYRSAAESTSESLDRIRRFETGVDKIDLSALGTLQLDWSAQTDAGDGSTYQLVTAAGAQGTLTIRVDGTLARADFVYLDAGQTHSGTAGDDERAGWNGNDQLFLQQGGNDRGFGHQGNDGFYFGGALNSIDVVDGGDGIDTLALQGIYPGTDNVLRNVVGVEVLLVLPGSDSRFGYLQGDSTRYALNSVDGNVAGGATLTVQASELRPGENLVFNGAAETDGKFRMFAGKSVDTLTGGAGSDGFFFGADGNLTGADRVVGGGGTDSIALRGNYIGGSAVVFEDASFSNVEVLTFLSGHTNEFGGVINAGGFDYDVTLANGTIAAGQRLDVIAGNLRSNESARVDARAEVDGSVRIISGAGDDILFGGAGNDILSGGPGADALDGSGGADSYVYRAAGESTGASRDTIVFGSGDKIDLSMVDANGGTPANDVFSFIGAAAFSNVAGQLRAAQSGDQWLVEGDVNGDGVADLVIAVTGGAPLVASDFVF